MTWTTILCIYLLIINLIAFIMYGRDKRLAKQKKWRIPESTLLLVAALGGGIGAELGMQIFRHKTKHAKFVIGVPIIIVLHLMIGFALWMSFH